MLKSTNYDLQIGVGKQVAFNTVGDFKASLFMPFKSLNDFHPLKVTKIGPERIFAS